MAAILGQGGPSTATKIATNGTGDLLWRQRPSAASQESHHDRSRTCHRLSDKVSCIETCVTQADIVLQEVHSYIYGFN